MARKIAYESSITVGWPIIIIFISIILMLVGFVPAIAIFVLGIVWLVYDWVLADIFFGKYDN